MVRFGDIQAEWEADDSLRIVRHDNGMHMVLSLSEWGLLLSVCQLHGWPTAPPLSVLDPSTQVEYMPEPETRRGRKRQNPPADSGG